MSITAGEATPEAKAGEAAPPTPAGDAGEVKLTPEQQTAVNARFARDKDAMLKAERKRWEAEEDDKRKRADMTEVDRLKAENAEKESKRIALESRLQKMDRGEKLRDAVAALGYVPPAYIRVAIDEAGDDFNAGTLAETLRTQYLADVARESGTTVPTKKEVAKTPGELAQTGDISKWTEPQAVAHGRTIKDPTKRLEFLDSWERAVGRTP